MKHSITLLIIFICLSITAQDVKLLNDINAGSDGSFVFGLDRSRIEYNGKFLFGADDGVHGTELWVYDGLETTLLKDIYEGPESSACDNFYHMNGKVVFTANDGIHGEELWETDGTAEGTKLLVDVREGSGNGVSSCCNNDLGRSFAVMNDEIYFNADIGSNQRRLYKSDGTPEGTIELGMLGGSQGQASGMTVFNGEIFFKVTFKGLWKTDGTPEGTVLLKEENHEGESFDALYIYNMGDYLLMVAGFDWDIWRSDGTEAGTTLVKEMVRPEAQSNQGLYFFKYKDFALFSGSNESNNTELWRTDGTEAGTYEIINIEDNDAFIPIYPRKKIILNDLVYYTGGKDDTGFQIYKTDGTEAGTEELINLDAEFSGAQVYFQSDMIATDDIFFFVAGRPFNRELWYSNGTAEGTMEIEVNPSDQSTPERLTIFGDELIFFANGEGVGYEPHAVNITNINVSSEDLEQFNALSIFPNPANEVININISGSDQLIYNIYDLQGQKLITSLHSSIDISNLTNGIYVVEILNTKKESRMTKKMMIVKK